MKVFIFLAMVVLAAAKRERIVGGANVANPGSWPWQASLQFKSSGSHTCGAVFIGQDWIVTAAHCVGSPSSTYRLALGLHDRTTQRQGKPYFYDITTITRHPQYAQDGSRGFPNDIAVMRLSENADVNRYTQAVNLPAASGAPDFVGFDCFITGWGRLFGGGPLPNILQEANIDILSESECQASWGSRITNIHICLSDRANNAKGACNGDSGGPLVCNTASAGQAPEWTLAGITSWGRSGCSTASPSVYARVATFRTWIQQQTGI